MTATAAAVAAAAKGGSSSSGSRRSITVYGGVPMTRHASMLSSQTQVVVGNPVLDEADTLLNFEDNTEVS